MGWEHLLRCRFSTLWGDLQQDYMYRRHPKIKFDEHLVPQAPRTPSCRLSFSRDHLKQRTARDRTKPKAKTPIPTTRTRPSRPLPIQIHRTRLRSRHICHARRGTHYRAPGRDRKMDQITTTHHSPQPQRGNQTDHYRRPSLAQLLFPFTSPSYAPDTTSHHAHPTKSIKCTCSYYSTPFGTLHTHPLHLYEK